MNMQKIVTLGTVGAAACIGACAAAALIPAALATGGLAFLSSEFVGWPMAIGVALLLAAAFLVWRRHVQSRASRSCANASCETSQ